METFCFGFDGIWVNYIGWRKIYVRTVHILILNNIFYCYIYIYILFLNYLNHVKFNIIANFDDIFFLLKAFNKFVYTLWKKKKSMPAPADREDN
jgi:hypothetical protein